MVAARFGGALAALVFACFASADAIDDYVALKMKEDHLPGVSIAIVRDGKIEKAQGYGFSNLELNVPATAQSVYRIASMSKQFCSASLELLKAEGKIDLEAPVKKYIPEAPASWDGVKIRHLMCHQSGIPNVTERASFVFSREYTERELISFLKPLPLDTKPGDKYHYSNSGYSLLGLIVGRVAGKPLGEFVKERIFKPLGMDDSTYFRLPNLVPNRANGYKWVKDHFENALPTRPTSMDGSGAVMSTVLDLAKWDAALYGESPLTSAMKAELWTANKTNDGKATVYGYGWTIRNGKYGHSVSHSGNTPGFTSNILRLVDKKLTVIVLRNSDPEGAADMALDIAELTLTGKLESRTKGDGR